MYQVWWNTEKFTKGLHWVSRFEDTLKSCKTKIPVMLFLVVFNASALTQQILFLQFSRTSFRANGKKILVANFVADASQSVGECNFFHFSWIGPSYN